MSEFLILSRHYRGKGMLIPDPPRKLKKPKAPRPGLVPLSTGVRRHTDALVSEKITYVTYYKKFTIYGLLFGTEKRVGFPLPPEAISGEIDEIAGRRAEEQIDAEMNSFYDRNHRKIWAIRYLLPRCIGKRLLGRLE